MPFDGQATALFLTASQEYALAKRSREGDIKAGQSLATRHLPLIKKIAKGFARPGLDMGDLISEGVVGMMEAIKRFDPDQNARLATYAAFWIKATIREYIARSRSVVKGADHDRSLNVPIGNDGREWQELLEDDRDNQEQKFGKAEETHYHRDLLRHALGLLEHIERDVLCARQISNPPVPLKTLGQTFGVSGERVRQIELLAFKKVTKYVNSRMKRTRR